MRPDEKRRPSRPAEDLLYRHLDRIGADEVAFDSAYGHLQVNMLRMFLNIVQAACEDEGLEPASAARIVERVIYGAVPQKPAAAQMKEMERSISELVERSPILFKIPSDSE